MLELSLQRGDLPPHGEPATSLGFFFFQTVISSPLLAFFHESALGRRQYRPLHAITRISRTPPPSTVIYDHTVLSHPSALWMPPWESHSNVLLSFAPRSLLYHPSSSAALGFQSPLSLYSNVSSISDPLKTGQFPSLSRHVSPELCQPASSPRPLYEPPGLQLHFAQTRFT